MASIVVLSGALVLYWFVAVRVERRRASRRRSADELRDALTGLPTVGVLDVHMRSLLAQARRSGEAVAFAAIDVDDFASVNETLGHAAGDHLLREVAERLDSQRRAGDLLAHHSGDEFLLVMARLDPGTAETVALGAVHRVLRTLDAPLAFDGVELSVQASAGISLFPRDAEDGDALRRHAAAALGSARSGLGRCAVYDRATAGPRPNRSLAARLRRAVERGELELHHQPIWSMTDDAILGVECLVRWRDGANGMVPPSDFIPLAEQTGVIHSLGAWVMAESCDTMRRWEALGLAPRFGVNVSPFQLDRPGLADDLHVELRRAGLPADRLVIELTESAWMLDSQRARPQLDALRDAGLKLAIDDFGAGHSSLGRLADLPVSVLKIDRALLAGVPEGAAAAAVLCAAVQLGDAVGCDVIAEGIETAEQHEHLRRLGVRFGQGFLMARPLPELDAAQLLLEHLAPSRRVPIGTGR